MSLYDRLILVEGKWPPSFEKSTGPRNLRSVLKGMGSKSREEVSRAGSASFIPKDPREDPVEAKRGWAQQERRRAQQRQRRGAPEKERSGDIGQSAARAKTAEERREAREKIMTTRKLKLPGEFLSKAIEQVGKSPTRRRLRKGAKAAGGPELPPVWGHLSAEQRKEWLRKQNESVSLHARVFTEGDWKTALAYGMATPEKYGGPSAPEKKKPKPKLPLRSRLLAGIKAVGKAAFPQEQ